MLTVYIQNVSLFLRLEPSVLSIRVIDTSHRKPLCLSLSKCKDIFPYMYMVFTTEGFSEVAIESWPEWDLNPQPLNSVQML